VKPQPISVFFYKKISLIFSLHCSFNQYIIYKFRYGKKTFRYPIYEDLTKDTFNLLQALLKDERTGPVWTVSGNIRYKLAGDTAVKKVSSVYESVDKILAK
jgi:hypothetical protein